MAIISEKFAWPKKTSELYNHHFDSSIWNDFQFRYDDIIIANYAKSGSTWIQQIVAQLLFNGEVDIDVANMSPWLDLRIPSKKVKLTAVQSQPHRRFLKTHLPVDALVFSPKAKYIYIGRDGRDVVWSLYHHHSTANAEWYKALNETPGRVGPPLELPTISIKQYYHDWLDKDGFPLWSFFDNIKSWYEIRNLPNVYLIHFENLKKSLKVQIQLLAAFLDIPIDESKLGIILKHCSFEYMKKHATKIVPLGGAFWTGGAQTFINKGTNGRWRNVLSEEESAKYKALALEKLGENCAHWLETGEWSREIKTFLGSQPLKYQNLNL